MTVKELKEKLAKYPDNMDVFIAKRKTEFDYGLVNSVTNKGIEYPDDEGLVVVAMVVVIDEE